MNAATGSSGSLDIGGIFEMTTDLWKKTFGTVWIVALILLVPAGIITGLLNEGGGFLQFIGSLVQMVAGVWLAGAVVKVVEDARLDGRVDASVGDLLGSVSSKIISLILLSIVLAILITIGYFLLIIPGVILTLMWIVTVPAMVVEDKGVFDSMSRSSDLTRDNRMRILGLGILLVIAYVAIIVAVFLLAAITPIIGIIVGIALTVIIYPWASIIVAVLYFDLREIKEGAAAPVDVPPVDAPPAV
ncbi:MAG: hypothetical protein M9938_02790 [Solirubrobacterales bacterium]|nr:hypothetical protein [Solirubrobacterales bacterium]